VVNSSGAGKLLTADDLEQLPAQKYTDADVIFLEYQEGNRELDHWIERTAADPQSPAIFLFFPEISTDCLWKALRLGAKECFSYPIKEEEFQQALNRVLARTARRPLGAPRIITLLGCKGGVGTTFLAGNAAVFLARKRQGQVLLLDLDLQYGQMSYLFDLQPQHTLTDAVSHFAELDPNYLQSLLFTRDKHLQILPSPSRPEEGEAVTPEHVEKILANAKKLAGFNWIIVDGGHRVDEVTLRAVELSDRLILVATPSIPALSNAKKILELLRLLGLERLATDLWLNGWRKDEDLTLEEVGIFLGKEVSGVIRYDHRQVSHSINEGRPLAETSPRHPVSQDLSALIGRLQGEEQPPENANGSRWGWLRRLGGRK
jgi:pilus assembly protein CpaE